MSRPTKFTIGIRFSRPHFKLANQFGQIADTLIDLTNEKGFEWKIDRTNAQFPLELKTRDADRTVRVDLENFTFTIDQVEQEKSLTFDDCHASFAKLWPAFVKTIGEVSVRRIGAVGEYRLKADSPSAKLLTVLTKLQAEPYGLAHGFHLQCEFARLDQPTTPFDRKKSGYGNTILCFWDNLRDTERPSAGVLTYSVDEQRHFETPLSKGVVDKAFELRKAYAEAEKRAQEMLKKLGLHA